MIIPKNVCSKYCNFEECRFQKNIIDIEENINKIVMDQDENINMDEGENLDPRLMVNRIFYAKFLQFLFWYNRVISKRMQRIIEFLMLLKAVLMLFLLVYMHFYFIRNRNGCLDYIKEALPKADILRLEIIQPHQRDYAELTGNIDQLFTLHESYSREMEARKLFDSELNRYNRKIQPYDGSTSEECEHKASISKYSYFHKKDLIELDSNEAEMFFPNKYPNSSVQQYCQKDVNNSSKDFNATIILEYSSKFALLSLCPITRYETNVSVLYVPLEPFHSTCFGGNIFIQHFLQVFNGYHPGLMHSIKTLLQEKDRGYVRNCITREYYLFLEEQMPLVNSLLISLICMSIFSNLTLVVFQFLNNFVTNTIEAMIHLDHLETLENIYSTISILLAIFGLKMLMNNFFQTDSFILIIMLMVWLGNKLSTLLFHHSMMRDYWLKFNYLYQFTFYVYYYRFNGQFGGLSLYVAWSFIEHSIVYFLHHYEIPRVVQHITIYEEIIRRMQQRRH